MKRRHKFAIAGFLCGVLVTLLVGAALDVKTRVDAIENYLVAITRG